MHVGKAAVHLGGCNISYGGKELFHEEYAVLCSLGGLQVVPAGGGVIPTGAVQASVHAFSSLSCSLFPPHQAGWEQDGSPLYAARALHEGGLHPGKACAGFGGCNIAYGGREISVPAYEVFCYAEVQSLILGMGLISPCRWAIASFPCRRYVGGFSPPSLSCFLGNPQMLGSTLQRHPQILTPDLAAIRINQRLWQSPGNSGANQGYCTVMT